MTQTIPQKNNKKPVKENILNIEDKLPFYLKTHMIASLPFSCKTTGFSMETIAKFHIAPIRKNEKKNINWFIY